LLGPATGELIRTLLETNEWQAGPRRFQARVMKCWEVRYVRGAILAFLGEAARRGSLETLFQY